MTIDHRGHRATDESSYFGVREVSISCDVRAALDGVPQRDRADRTHRWSRHGISRGRTPNAIVLPHIPRKYASVNADDGDLRWERRRRGRTIDHRQHHA